MPVWLSLTRRVESLCKKSFLWFAIRSCCFARASLAFLLFALHFIFLDSLRCRHFNLASHSLRNFGLSIFSQVERVANVFSHRSIPIVHSLFGIGFVGIISGVSTRIDTIYFPVLVCDTVTVPIFPINPLSCFIFTSHNFGSFSFQFLISTHCGNCIDFFEYLFLKLGNLVFFLKKPVKALSRLRKDIWRDCAGVNESHSNSSFKSGIIFARAKQDIFDFVS